MTIGDLPNKKWFSWSLVAILILANVVSYQMANQYFKQVNPNITEEVVNSSNYFGSGNKVIDWARDILRFFKNP